MPNWCDICEKYFEKDADLAFCEMCPKDAPFTTCMPCFKKGMSKDHPFSWRCPEHASTNPPLEQPPS